MIKSRILILVDIVITMLFLIASIVITPNNANYFIHITFYAIITRILIDSIVSLLKNISITLKPKNYQYYSKLFNNIVSKLVKFFKYDITSWVKTISYCLLIIVYIIYFTLNISEQSGYVVMYLIITSYAVYILSRLILIMLYGKDD